MAADKGKIAEFCRKHRIKRLAFFGSVLRGDFSRNSDLDVLIEFEPESAPGLFGLARMERKLSVLLGGRRVDLRTPEDLERLPKICSDSEPHQAGTVTGPTLRLS